MEVPTERDDGQVLPLVALVLVFAAILVVALGRLAVETSARARATTAADAAALAGAIDGEDAARRVATANDAVVVSFERLPGGDVRVHVECDGVSASARARARTTDGEGARRGAWRVVVTPAMRAALARAEQVIGRPVRAAPDRSGVAVEVPAEVADELANLGSQTGLCRPFPDAEPLRFRLCGEGFTPSTDG